MYTVYGAAPAPTPDGFAYSTPLPPVVEQVLQATPEEVPTVIKTSYSSYVSSGGGSPAPASNYLLYADKPAGSSSSSYATDLPPVAIASAYMNLEGKDDDDRAQALVQQAELISLSSQHGEGPLYERDDRRHRIGELLIAAWKIYERSPECAVKRKRGMGGKASFFLWLDKLPEWQRISMLSEEIRKLGTGVLGTPEQRKLLADETKRANLAGVHQELNLRPSVVKAFLTGVKYLDAATRPNYVVSFTGNKALYRGRPFSTASMKTVFSGPGFGIWVMEGNGTLYAGNHVYGQMHHSSFLAGGAILAGGEIRATNGNIEFISGKSGHYCPPIKALINGLNKLKAHGVNISAIRVLVWGAPMSRTTAAQIIRGDAVVADAGKNFVSWGHLTARQKSALQAGQYDAFA